MEETTTISLAHYNRLRDIETKWNNGRYYVRYNCEFVATTRDEVVDKLQKELTEEKERSGDYYRRISDLENELNNHKKQVERLGKQLSKCKRRKFWMVWKEVSDE